ncbi:hypothetical protein [Paraburkholderia nemoris]|uniref:hypothetical protein n=1 Tax=Paraburkholderia nemoris TaxID=2793076 RepID=UPI001B05B8FB|nr:hypothetical protein [Paraburkholderia nemoris]CAE6792857.1 hypothetical protein LMG22931_05037 [Paraburkholderia nemoris]
MSESTGKADTTIKPGHNAAIGGWVFFFAGPTIGAVCLSAIIHIVWTLSGELSDGSSGLYIQMVPLIVVGALFLGYGIPAALTGILMGWLGVRFSRRQAVCCGTLIGVLLTAGYAVLENYCLMGEVSPSGIGMMAIPGALVPSAILSWWLHRRIERQTTGHCDAPTTKPVIRLLRKKSLYVFLLTLTVVAKIYSDWADASRARHDIHQIRLGDTSERVRSILGNPTSIREACGGIDADQIAQERAAKGCSSDWAYGFFLDPEVEVLLEPNGRVGSMFIKGN